MNLRIWNWVWAVVISKVVFLKNEQTLAYTPDQCVIIIILSKSNLMSCNTLYQVRMENGLKLCLHSFYGGFIVVGELNKTPVKKKRKKSTAESIRFDLSGYTHTELFSNFEPVQTWTLIISLWVKHFFTSISAFVCNLLSLSHVYLSLALCM